MIQLRIICDNCGCEIKNSLQSTGRHLCVDCQNKETISNFKGKPFPLYNTSVAYLGLICKDGSELNHEGYARIPIQNMACAFSIKYENGIVNFKYNHAVEFLPVHDIEAEVELIGLYDSQTSEYPLYFAKMRQLSISDDDIVRLPVGALEMKYAIEPFNVHFGDLLICSTKSKSSQKITTKLNWDNYFYDDKGDSYYKYLRD